MPAQLFSRNALSKGFYLLIAILSPALLSGCTGGRNEPTSATNTPPSTQTEARATDSPSLPTPTPVATAEATPATPPQPAEVEAALARVYQTAVVADARDRASAVTGDFNGDNSQDIAIVVKPSREQLTEINSEFSNWILEDPRQVLAPSSASRVDQRATPPPARTQVGAGDTLLAVIHGFKSEGWRNADAKQTYLLKNGVGTQMRTQTRLEARQTFKAAAAHHLPSLRGDLICQVLDGKAGCLYWTGAKYGWFDETPNR
jgi:hypothetical protein